jgi:outer membrane protein OmpA-like peptidoglycan-associated protein
MYDEYDDGEGGSSLARKIAVGVGVVAIVAAGFFAYQAVSKDDGGQVSEAGSSVAPGEGTTTTAPPDDVASETSSPASTEATTERSTRVTTTTAPPTTVRATTTTARATTTTAAPTTTTTAAPTTVPQTYDTLPDGSPAWVVALFDTNRITLTGAVPDQAAKDRLEALATANAKPGQAETIDNQVTINPAVPRNVGVRVVELTSVRFPENSAEVTPEHAAELNRVATIMNALPNITVLVIGHADQRGNEVSNFAISDARADAVTTYLAGQGIAPSRMQSRAVGEEDLLSLNNDDAAFALNRRTEFVFFGLLIE